MQTDGWIGWARARLVLGLSALYLLVGLSGCWTAPDARTSALYGASQGAVIGGVVGCSFAYSFASTNHEGTAFAIGCPIGIVAGAAIGGLVGYAMYGPPPKQYKSEAPSEDLNASR
jgi:hypothetical protein